MTPRAAWWLTFLGALGFYWTAAALSGFDWSREFRLVRHSAQVRGQIMSRDPANHNAARYVYNVGHHDYQSTGAGPGAIGASVIVYYLPDDPAFSTLEEPGSHLWFMIPAPLALSLFVAFGVRARIRRVR